MYLQAGSYAHADNEVWFNIDKSARFSPRGRMERIREVWTIMGVLIGDDETDLTSKMQALANAYVNGVDLTFFGNGGAQTHHVLLSANTINGTQVQRLRWLPGNPGVWGSGTEYVNKRSYQIVVTADTLVNSSNLYFYRATLSGTGTTGPKKIWMPSLTAPVQQQITQSYTTQRIVQSGFNIGLVTPEPPDSPLWPPDVEHLDMRRVERISPQEVGINVSLKFGMRWSYFFESPVPLMVV